MINGAELPELMVNGFLLEVAACAGVVAKVKSKAVNRICSHFPGEVYVIIICACIGVWYQNIIAAILYRPT